MQRDLTPALLSLALLAGCSAGSRGATTTGGSGGSGGADAHAPVPTATFVRARAEADELLSFVLGDVERDADGTADALRITVRLFSVDAKASPRLRTVAAVALSPGSGASFPNGVRDEVPT